MYEFFAISFIIVLAAISPGPDFAMVVKNSLSGSRTAGLYTALGVTISLLIHSSYGIFGLAMIISKSLLLFSAIKIIGAAYLIYIGIKSMMEKRQSVQQSSNHFSSTPIQNKEAFMQGLFCNLLNPKAILFILAFFTMILKPESSFTAQFGFGVEIAIVHLVWFSLLAIIITHPATRTVLSRVQYYIVKMMGAALIGFGVRIASLSAVTN